MDNRKKSLILITVLTFFYGLYYWGIPAFINIEKRITSVENFIQEKTGIKISVEQPYVKMGHTPAIWFMAENIAILNSDGSKATNLEHSAIKIHLLPLLAGKIHIGNFSSDKIAINLIYTKDGELKLGEYLLPQIPKSNMILSRAYFRLGNYKINLNDQKQNKNIILDGNYLTLDEFKNNKRIKLSTFAKLFVDKKSSEILTDIDIKLPINKITEDQFKINGRISNLDLADFSDYIEAISNNSIKSLSGLVNMVAETKTTENNHKNIFSKITIKNLGILQEDSAKSIYCKDTLEIKTDMDTIQNGLNISNMQILTKGIDTKIKGEITNLESKNPTIDTTISIKNSRTENFIPLIPGLNNAIEEVDFYALKKYPFFGDIEGNLTLKGKALTPDINGYISVKNGYLIKPLPYKTPKATINLTFNDTNMHIDAKVPTPNNNNVFVFGNQELYGEKIADLDIKSSSNIDLKVAQLVLNPLHEILKFDLGPVPIMQINGTGNIDLKVKGTRKEPHCWGKLFFQNATALFNDINNMIIKNASGYLEFDDQNTHFYTSSANLNGKPISADGTCSLKGDLDFNIKADQQDLGYLLTIIKTSPMLEDIQKLLKPISYAKGLTNLNLNITGRIIDINDIVFNKNIFAKGDLVLFSNTAKVQNIPITNINGKIDFENLDTNFDLNSTIGSSKLKIAGDLKEQIADIKINSTNFILKDGINLLNIKLPFKEDFGKIHTSFNAQYKGEIEKIEPKGINIKGKVHQYNGYNINIEDLPFEVVNGNLKNTNIKGLLKTSPFNININASNILSEKQLLNGSFNFYKLNLANLKEITNYLGIQNIQTLSGTINLSGQINNNNLFADTQLDDVSFTYLPEKLPIKIASGKIQLKNNILILNKINSLLGEMPVFTDGKISNLDKTPYLNIYINAKPTQKFVDQFFNNKAVYPIKLKGDINCTSNLSGTLKALHNKTQLKLAENASIYYMGATLGSHTDNNSSLLTADNIIYPIGITINNFQYDKLIPSQNNILHKKTLLTAAGNIGFLPNNDIKFNNFKIKTQEPTDAKIFNIIFRKPFMKQGIFTSDIILNGKASEPIIGGKLHITSIDMPLFDAIVNDIDLDFKKDNIYLNSKGIILTNNLNISAVMRNNPKPPMIFEDIKINLEDLDLNKISETLRDYDVNAFRNISSTSQSTSIPDLSQVIIKGSEITANKIKIKNLDAKDFLAHVILNDKMQLEVEDFKFKTAEGEINGNIKYNLLNNLVNLSMKIKETNAQIVAETLFGLKGQIYGIVTGDINLYCNGKSQDLCTQTLGGEGQFVVADGKMPKLGSLEYLLKAGNLVKGGLTGLSINGIIDLITPHKTGDFDSIKGSFHVANGIADDIQIYSDGKDLNMYMKGTYNFTNLIADMQIFGALTKNFSTLFGKIANASLNTLFNTIPGINISEAPSVLTDDIKKIPNSENAARMFAAEIYGDINGDNYVKSFKWLK